VDRCESLLYSDTTIREQMIHPNDSEIILDDNDKKVDKFRYQDSFIITEDSGIDIDVSV
jgi:hypothetical protein